MSNALLIEILSSENFEERLLELSYEERLDIVCSSGTVRRLIMKRVFEENIVLFNEEETSKILADEQLFDDVAYGFGSFNSMGILSLSNLSNLDLIIKNNLLENYLFVLSDDVLEKLLTRDDLREYEYLIISHFKSDEYKDPEIEVKIARFVKKYIKK